MLVPKVTLPAAVRFLPENLASLLRPGKVLVARVETIEGRLLTLQVGEERLEALLEERIPLRMLKPGQSLKLKVISTGYPVVLSLMLPRQDHLSMRLARLVKSFAVQIQKGKLEEEEGEPSLERLFWRFVETIKPEGGEKETGGAKDLKETILKTWQEGVFFIPLVFGDRVSWAYLFEEKKKSQSSGSRFFVLRLFLSRAGFLEVHFRLLDGKFFLELYFAREEALNQARSMREELETALEARGFKVHLSLANLSALPGAFLDAAG